MQSYRRTDNRAVEPHNQGMNAEIEAHLPEIKELCERYGVVRLELFGSATGPDFDPETSDFDFIADFADRGLGYGYRVLDFEFALKDVLGRHIDLLSKEPEKNPYFVRAVNESRQIIYERTSAEASV